MEIELSKEDAKRFQRLSEILGDNERALSFSLGLSLAVLGIRKPDVSPLLEPRNRNQRREPSLRD